MKEYTAPGEVPLHDGAHLVEPLLAHARTRPGHALLAYRDGDRFVDVSAQEAADRIERLARGLIAIGVEAGDRVVIMSESRIEWLYLDYAILSAGAVTVPIYDTSSAEQIEWIMSDSGAVAGFFSNADLKASYDKVAGNLSGVKATFTLDEGGLDELERRGADVEPARVTERIDGLKPDDLATIIYTSGTTGRPKGCVLTHANLRSNSLNVKKLLEKELKPDDSQLLFLPMAHSFAKILVMASVEMGTKIGFATSPQHLIEELPMFQPTFLAAVPRIFEKVYTGARNKAAADGKDKIFDKAADVATKFSEAQADGGKPGLALKLQHALFDKLVYGKLRNAFGGRLRMANSGGGPLGPRLNHFFNGIGVKIYEGYGLTETSPVLTTNYPGSWKIGTVGRPIPGTTIRIADDGEILAKGPQVFQGYWNNEQATADTFSEGAGERWFHTGDIGELDGEGFLKITGRKKELIVTAGGKNVAPAVLEDRLRSHPLVSQAVVVGDNKPFIAALVTIDEEQFPIWAEQHSKQGRKVADLLEDPDLRAEVQKAVDHANAAVSKAESIRKFEILPQDFAIETGELTPSLKVKRNVVHDRYADEVEALYS